MRRHADLHDPAWRLAQEMSEVSGSHNVVPSQGELASLGIFARNVNSWAPIKIC